MVSDMSEGLVDLQLTSPGVALATLNLPQLRNAMTTELTSAWTAVVDKLAGDRSLRALVVTGKARKEDEEKHFLHRGIARRAFERRFQLADHIRVAGASLDNGLLHVDLVREVPEALKPRKIEITSGTQPQALEDRGLMFRGLLRRRSGRAHLHPPSDPLVLGVV